MALSDFNGATKEGNLASGRGGANAEWERAMAAPETVQERLKSLAAAVVQELRKGVDIGSIAAARAQAIRR